MATKRKEEWEKIQRKGMRYKVKPNEYDLKSKEYGIGYCKNGNEFYFDLEDYDLIKCYRWNRGNNNYARSTDKFSNYSEIVMHRLILNYNKDNPLIIDHINRIKHDNRKENLRLVTPTQNTINMATYKKTLDKSGVKGVTWDKTKNKWQSTIRLNRKLIKLGHFEKDDLELAILTRLKAEKEYFGEYSAQQHLFERYKI